MLLYNGNNTYPWRKITQIDFNDLGTQKGCDFYAYLHHKHDRMLIGMSHHLAHFSIHKDTRSSPPYLPMLITIEIMTFTSLFAPRAATAVCIHSEYITLCKFTSAL